MNMSSSRSVKIVFKAVEGTLKNSQVEVKKMLSLKEVEFQFWEKFSQFDDDDDNDNDNVDFKDEQIRSSSHKQKRLNYADMSLYGQWQDRDVFSVVTCYSCGMILKPQAFNDHLKKRHSFDSLSDTNELSEPIVPVDTVFEHKAKRYKADKSPKIQENTESHPSGESPTLILKQTKKFFKANSLVAQKTSTQTIIAQRPKAVRIKMKLKKSNHGSWTVVTA